MPQKFLDRPFVTPSFILGLGLILAAAVVSYALYSIRALDNTLSVTGSAKQEVTADTAKWTIQVYRTVYQEGVQAAYSQVAKDSDAVKAYFKTAGIAEEDMTSNTITSDQDWSYNANGGPARYMVHQDITISSKDVEKIQGLSQGVSTLINRGYTISPRQPEFYVSNLPELRVSLLGEAIKDAKARANEIAKSGGSSVGKLRGASSGVVQVMAPNSTNVDDYGSYDTSTIKKEVSVTARATFLVK